VGRWRLMDGAYELFKRPSPSVVHITTLAAQRDMLSMSVQQVPRGTGTSFIWDEAGHIVTNFHVIQGGSSARVTWNDQTTVDARLVGAFPDRAALQTWRMWRNSGERHHHRCQTIRQWQRWTTCWPS